MHIGLFVRVDTKSIFLLCHSGHMIFGYLSVDCTAIKAQCDFYVITDIIPSEIISTNMDPILNRFGAMSI